MSMFYVSIASQKLHLTFHFYDMKFFFMNIGIIDIVLKVQILIETSKVVTGPVMCLPYC